MARLQIILPDNNGGQNAWLTGGNVVTAVENYIGTKNNDNPIFFICNDEIKGYYSTEELVFYPNSFLRFTVGNNVLEMGSVFGSFHLESQTQFLRLGANFQNAQLVNFTQVNPIFASSTFDIVGSTNIVSINIDYESLTPSPYTFIARFAVPFLDLFTLDKKVIVLHTAFNTIGSGMVVTNNFHIFHATNNLFDIDGILPAGVTRIDIKIEYLKL